MKSSRLFIILLIAVLVILALTVFLRELPIRSPSVIPIQSSDVDYPKWELPDGAKTRLGKGKVNNIKFSPDGALFAVATTIGIWMYDAKSGKETDLFSGERQDVKSIAFTSDGEYITGASYGGEISRWYANTGELLGTLEKVEEDDFHSAFLSEDGTKLVSTELVRVGDGINNKVHLRKLDDNNTHIPNVRIIDLEDPPEDTKVNVLSPNGSYLATTMNKKNFKSTIYVYNADTGVLLLTLDRTKQRLISSLTFSPDSKILASADGDSIHLWDLKGGDSRATFKTVYGFNSLVYSPNSNFIACGMDNGSITLWNTTTRQQGLSRIFNKYSPSLEIKGHKEVVTALAFSPDGNMLISGSDDGTIRAWDTTTGEQQYLCPGHIDEITDMAVTENGDTIISVESSNSYIQHWNIGTGHQSSITFLNRLVSAEAVSPNATTLVMKDFRKKNIRFLDISENSYFVGIDQHGYSKNAYSFVFEFSPDEKLLAISSDDQVGIIQLWDIANSNTDRPLYILKEHKSKVRTLIFSPNGKMLACGGYSKEIDLWNTETGDHLFTLTGKNRSNIGISFSPDSKTLASSSYSSINFWDLTSGVLIRNCEIGNSSYPLLFSPDGKTLVVGGWKGQFHLYDMQTCHLMSSHKGHSSRVNHIKELVFIEEGKTLASTSGDGTIMLWDWEKISQGGR